MARGRKRKEGIREKSGRLQRPTLAQQIAAKIEAENVEKIVVLAQPHRRGERDQKAESALGRFVMRRSLDAECYQAGLQYAALRRQWLAAVGAPMPERLSGKGADIDMDVVRAWRARLNAMEDAMMGCGVAALGWCTALAGDDKDIPAGHPSEDAVACSLIALAVEIGMLSPRRS